MDNLQIPTEIKSDILANLFTKCTDCKLKLRCKQHEDKIVLLLESLRSRRKEIVDRKKEKVEAIEWSRQLDKEYDIFYDEQLRIYNEQIKDIDCAYEKQEVISLVQKLQQRYDLSDPRVYIIVQQQLRQAVLDMRLYKDTASNGTTIERYTQDGVPVTIVNPLFTIKMQSTKLVVDMIKTLDTITKEDEMMNNFKTSGKGLFSDFLSKVPHTPIVEAEVISNEADIQDEDKHLNDTSKSEY